MRENKEQLMEMIKRFIPQSSEKQQDELSARLEAWFATFQDQKGEQVK